MGSMARGKGGPQLRGERVFFPFGFGQNSCYWAGLIYTKEGKNWRNDRSS